jgi:hypothetical protein
MQIIRDAPSRGYFVVAAIFPIAAIFAQIIEAAIFESTCRGEVSWRTLLGSQAEINAPLILLAAIYASTFVIPFRPRATAAVTMLLAGFAVYMCWDAAAHWMGGRRCERYGDDIGEEIVVSLVLLIVWSAIEFARFVSFVLTYLLQNKSWPAIFVVPVRAAAAALSAGALLYVTPVALFLFANVTESLVVVVSLFCCALVFSYSGRFRRLGTEVTPPG